MTTVTDTATQAPFAEPNPYAAPAAETRGFSIASLVLGVMALKREPASRTMAVWGIVLNAVMLAGTVLVTLGALVFGLAMLPFAFL